MGHCNKGCGGGCCQKSSGEILLCREEVEVLLELSSYAYLPIVQTIEDEQLRYISLEDDSKQYSDVISALERKKLITVDPDLSMQNVDYGAFKENASMRCGSIALTLQGQEAIDWLTPSDFDITLR